MFRRKSRAPSRVLIGDPFDPVIQELMNFTQEQWKPRLAELMVKETLSNAGGQFYQDSRVPFGVADDTAVTLLTTAKALWTPGTDTPTSKGDWYIGKRFHLRAAGRITTAATPGNLTFSVAYGTADNTGILSTTAALTLIAAQTNIMWNAEAYITARAIGAAGSLFATGVFETSAAVVASTGGPIPGSAAAAVASDLTAASALNFQAARSGSTVETMQVQDKLLTSLN